MKLKIFPYLGFWMYYVLLMILYHLEVKHYFYWDFIANLLDGEFDFSWFHFFISTLLFWLNLWVLISKKSAGFIYAVATVFFLLLTVPSLVAFTSKQMYPTQLLVFHQLFFYLLVFIGSFRFSLDKIPSLNKKQALWLLFLVLCVGVVPYLIVYGPHINLKNLLLIDVYKTRNEVAGISNPYFGYTYSLFTKIIIPLLLVFALELKNRSLAVISVLFLILFYLFGAHKGVFLGVMFILIFYRFSYRSMSRKMVLAVNALLFICLLLAFFSSDYLWILTVRRVQFLPTLLDICYFDFFSDQPTFWSESVLGNFIEYPFEERSTHLIGQTYFGRDDVSANNGLISDGYMNANSAGVLINILLVSGYFMILNNLKLPSRYFGLYFRVAISFISSSVPTVFLTHGAIALLLVSIFLLNRKEHPV